MAGLRMKNLKESCYSGETEINSFGETYGETKGAMNRFQGLVKRRKRACKTAYETATYARYPSAGIVCDCASHLVLAVVPGSGPNPDDKHYRKAVALAARRATIGTILADAVYDSESAHLFAREKFNMRTIIPATRGRPT